MRLEIKKIGNSTDLILPKDLLARLRLEQGDQVLISEGPGGSFTVSKHDDDDEETMRIARAHEEVCLDLQGAGQMSELRWITYDQIVRIHDEQLLIFGGPAGLRDAGLLQSAIDRPRNKFGYGETSLPALAAAYGDGLARNHPFVGGNMRMAFAAMVVVLAKNGVAVDFPSPMQCAPSLNSPPGSGRMLNLDGRLKAGSTMFRSAGYSAPHTSKSHQSAAWSDAA